MGGRDPAAVCLEEDMQKLMMVLILGAGLGLGGCNTVKGVGEDIKSVGEAGERAI